MNRRELLKLTVLTGGAFSLPMLTGFNDLESKNIMVAQSGHIQIKLNSLELFIFSDGHISLNNPQPIFAPGISPQNLRKELKRIFLAQDKLESAINVVLIKIADKIVLIDSGSGYHFGKNGGWLQSNLQRSGIKKTDITDIFITHAHIDHIGGILTKENTLVYPNAQYHIARKEFDFWTSNNPDFSKSKDTSDQSANIKIIRTILGHIKNKLNYFNYGDELFSCIKTELAEGHTPGHTIFTIFSKDKFIKHVVDTFHSPLLISKPGWGTQWDIDFHKAIHTRKQILKECYLNGILVMSTHLPWPGLGYIDKNFSHYQWIPFSYFIPNEIEL